jgi:formate hydrogenlyase subunit 3/multisubunit Na+/H+ antiporter MnhD subunit
MLIPLIVLPLCVALACLLLNRRVATRRLGIGAAAGLLVAALALVYARVALDLPAPVFIYTWLELDGRPIVLGAQIDAAGMVLALLPLGGGALALLALALAITPNLRGFGGLFAILTIMFVIVAIGLLRIDDTSLPMTWSAAALAGFIALRQSGAFRQQGMPLGAAIGSQLGALLLLGVILVAPVSEIYPDVAGFAAAALLLAVLLMCGGPWLYHGIDAASTTPAALGGALIGLGMPLLGGATVIAYLGLPQALPTEAWRAAALAFGCGFTIAGAAGALGAPGVRQIVGRQASAQLGLVIMAAAVSEFGRAVVAPALLVNMALTTLALGLATAALERRHGSDVLSRIQASGALVGPGLVFLYGAAAAIGLPGTWGMWGRLWLFDEVRQAAPWAIGPLLAGSALMALALVAPFAAFWRADAQPDAGDRRAARWGTAAVTVAPLVLFGIAPDLLWHGWLMMLRDAAGLAPEAAPWLPGVAGRIGMIVAALLLPALVIMGSRVRTRRVIVDPDVAPAGVMAPHAIGRTSGRRAAVGESPEPFGDLLAPIVRQLARLAPFQQRYYMASLVISLIVVILIFL